MANNTISTLVWALVTDTPVEVPSQYAGVESAVNVQRDGEEKIDRIYWKKGSDFDYLIPDDWVLVEWRSGKWRIVALTKQTPELQALLKERKPAPMPPPSPSPSSSQPSTPKPHPPSPGGNDYRDIAEMAVIFKGLRLELPDVDDEAIAALAQSVFKYRRDARR